MTESENGWRGLDRRYLLEGTLVTSLILGPSIAVALALDLKQGSIAEWVAAIATLAAFFAAVYAGRAAVAALRIELAREGDRLERDRQDQASRVAAWAGQESNQAQTPDGRKFSFATTSYGAWLRNASDVPVSEVVLHYVVDDGMPAESEVGLLPPSDDPTFRAIEDTQNEWWDVHEGFQYGRTRVEMTFRDARDQPWTRRADGQLVNQYAAWRPGTSD